MINWLKNIFRAKPKAYKNCKFCNGNGYSSSEDGCSTTMCFICMGSGKDLNPKEISLYWHGNLKINGELKDD